ncbi:MAG: twin-arginine translocase TatA/TatE family subunit [Actinomycetota bacterium]
MLLMLDPPEIVLILVVVLVLFGGAQLPKLAKNLGKAQKEFKEGLAEGQKEATKAAEAKKAASASDAATSDED